VRKVDIQKNDVDKRYDYGYTHTMKTAISLPDSLYSDAEKIAESMGIPRSQLFARALEEFIKQHKQETITDRLNQLYMGNYLDENEINNVGIEAIRKLTENDTW